MISDDDIIRLSWRDKLAEFGLIGLAIFLAGLITAVVHFGILVSQYLLIRDNVPGLLDDSVAIVFRIVLSAAIGNGCAFISYSYLIRLIFKGHELRDERIDCALNRPITVSGLNVRAEKIYAIKGRTANAVVAGLFRKAQYIFFTDKLLERMNEEEIGAIFAHELAHSRHWHLPRMLLAIILWVLAVQVVLQLVGFSAYLDTLDAFWQRGLWISGVTFGNMYALMFLVLFPLSRRNEYQADATAVRWVGINCYKDALYRLYQVNDNLKPPRRFIAKLGTHPTLQERLEEVRESNFAN